MPDVLNRQIYIKPLTQISLPLISEDKGSLFVEGQILHPCSESHSLGFLRESASSVIPTSSFNLFLLVPFRREHVSIGFPIDSSRCGVSCADPLYQVSHLSPTAVGTGF